MIKEIAKQLMSQDCSTVLIFHLLQPHESFLFGQGLREVERNGLRTGKSWSSGHIGVSCPHLH
jgi:hypothetical protein